MHTRSIQDLCAGTLNLTALFDVVVDGRDAMVDRAFTMAQNMSHVDNTFRYLAVAAYANILSILKEIVSRR